MIVLFLLRHQEARRLNTILEAYKIGSGQLVNPATSAIFFSRSYSAEAETEVTQCLNIEREALEEKYLGLPTAIWQIYLVGAFEKICSRIQNLVNGWCLKKLGAAGREILIKAVAQSVPTFSMSYFPLSKTTCKKITSSLARYWWGGDGDTSKLYWKKWSDIAHTKIGGYMGFMDVHLVNIAMLGKQAWRLVTKLWFLERPHSSWKVLLWWHFHGC